MKKLLLLLVLSLVMPNQIHAAATCTAVDQTDLARMKEYLTCQQAPIIQACVTLGSVLAGRFVKSAISDDQVGKFENNRRAFTQQMAEEMHARTKKGLTVDTRTARKEAEKAIREIENNYEKAMSDKSLSADTKINVKKDLLTELAKKRAIVQSCLDAELKGQFKIHPPVLEPLGQGKFVDVANKTFKELPEMYRLKYTDDAAEIYTKALSQIRSGKAFASTFTGNLAKVESRLLVKGGMDLLKRGALLAVGAGSLASQVGLMAMTYSPSTGCSSLTDKYTNAQGSDCEPQVGLSKGVLEFLDMDSEAQVQWLKDPKVCSFYAKLKYEVFNQSVGKVSCEGNAAKYQVYHKPYGSYQSTIRFREDKSIQSVQSDFGADGSVVYQVDEKGKDVSLKAEGLKKKAKDAAEQSVQAAKLFASNVASCCQSEGAKRDACLKDYNGPEPVKLIGADGSLNAPKGAK